ncbi:MAG: GNAT family N-acetyltransferase [Sphaerochaeta sp.]
MIIERANPSDHQDLKELWLIVFNEEPTFLEHFFATRISYPDIFVAREDGKLVSALHAMSLSYHKQGKTYPAHYIVGAATYSDYRRRGIMSKLLEATKQAYDHPITLFPAVRPFYEANGYMTTSTVCSFPLDSQKFSTDPCCKEARSLAELNAIYQKATEERGGLIRDEEAWKFLSDGYELLSVEGGYAFLSEGKAVETMAQDALSAKRLLTLLQKQGVKELLTLEDSPIAALLGGEKGVPIPMGMSTSKELQGVYIAEQY